MFEAASSLGMAVGKLVVSPLRTWAVRINSKAVRLPLASIYALMLLFDVDRFDRIKSGKDLNSTCPLWTTVFSTNAQTHRDAPRIAATKGVSPKYEYSCMALGKHLVTGSWVT